MRWEGLFADMESQLAAAEAQGVADEVAELTRAERSRVELADRLRAASQPESPPVTLAVRSGDVVSGRVVDAATAWVLVVDGPREHLVPLGAVVRISGLASTAAPPVGSALRRLGLGHALRAVARDRSVVRLTVGTDRLEGRIDAVGADHLDLTTARGESGRRPTGESHTVPFAGLDLVTSL